MDLFATGQKKATFSDQVENLYNHGMNAGDNKQDDDICLKA